MVDVAQLVEHQIVALVVVGSIPTIHPNFRFKAKIVRRSLTLPEVLLR